MSFADKIKAQTSNVEPSEVKKLVLDGCKAPELAALAPYTKLTSLSLMNCSLSSLDGLPPFPELVVLKLSDNRLAGGLERSWREDGREGGEEGLHPIGMVMLVVWQEG